MVATSAPGALPRSRCSCRPSADSTARSAVAAAARSSTAVPSMRLRRDSEHDHACDRIFWQGSAVECTVVHIAAAPHGDASLARLRSGGTAPHRPGHVLVQQPVPSQQQDREVPTGLIAPGLLVHGRQGRLRTAVGRAARPGPRARAAPCRAPAGRQRPAADPPRPMSRPRGRTRRRRRGRSQGGSPGDPTAVQVGEDSAGAATVVRKLGEVDTGGVSPGRGHRPRRGRSAPLCQATAWTPRLGAARRHPLTQPTSTPYRL